jgi:hypothetical protein
MTRPTPQPPFDLFITRYDGECAACSSEINPGDRVGRVQMRYRRFMDGVMDNPYPRVCCEACYADAGVNGDPSLRW